MTTSQGAPSLSAAQQMNIVWRDPQTLAPAARNARTHSDRQIAQIMASIQQFGFTNPVLLDSEGRIVAGHGRLEAAKRLGLAQMPTIALAHLTPEELRAYALADNKLAENAGWDPDILKIEMQELIALDLSFDLEITGFTTGEMEVLLDGGAAAKVSDAEAIYEPEDLAVFATDRGDLWRLGHHRLLCGDARELEDVVRVMNGERARMVFSDAPFNVEIEGHVSGLGAVTHSGFAMASGEMTRQEFTAFLSQAFANQVEVSLDGALHYQCMDWRHIGEMMQAGEAAYAELKNLCVWTKDNGGMGSFYRSQHELVFVWKVGTAPHINTVELGKNGRYRTNVWAYAGASSLGKGRSEALAMHPTVKPVAMIMDAVKDASRRGDVVLDPFGGSGSTLIAAHKTGRKARLVEYEPRYCDVTVRRWQALTKQAAVLDGTGETFDEVLARKRADRQADLALA